MTDLDDITARWHWTLDRSLGRWQGTSHYHWPDLKDIIIWWPGNLAGGQVYLNNTGLTWLTIPQDGQVTGHVHGRFTKHCRPVSVGFIKFGAANAHRML